MIVKVSSIVMIANIAPSASIVYQFLVFFFLVGGGLNAYPDGLRHLFREELSSLRKGYELTPLKYTLLTKMANLTKSPTNSSVNQ